MVNAIKCDKCLEFTTEGVTIHTFELHTDNPGDIDLCSECFNNTGISGLLRIYQR